MIIDSDVLINFLKNKKEVVQKIDVLKKNSTELSTTSVNSFELYCGNNYLSSKSDSEALNYLVSFLSIYDFSFAASKKASEIFNYLKSKGEMIEITDIMIASICITNNQSLLTGNTKHFSKIPELKLESL